jgi:DNA-binding NarL/FixJ family response regulator
LIEDEILIADGLRWRFRSPSCSIKILGYTNKLSVGIDKIKDLKPDIALLDLFLGKSDPVQNFLKLKNNFPELPIIIHSSEGCLWWKWRMMLEGSFGYVVKEWDVDELTHTICKVAEGHYVKPYDLLLFFTKQSFLHGIDTLTTYELDILLLRKEGLQNKEISRILKISVSAIEKKISKLCITFNVGSINDIIKELFNTYEFVPNIRPYSVFNNLGC